MSNDLKDQFGHYQKALVLILRQAGGEDQELVVLGHLDAVVVDPREGMDVRERVGEDRDVAPVVEALEIIQDMLV